MQQALNGVQVCVRGHKKNKTKAKQKAVSELDSCNISWFECNIRLQTSLLLLKPSFGFHAEHSSFRDLYCLF